MSVLLEHKNQKKISVRFQTKAIKNNFYLNAFYFYAKMSLALRSGCK